MLSNRHLYINGYELEVNDDEIIAISKQVNNIAELKDRQADFTTNFKVPDCRKNRTILQEANLLSSETSIPYYKNSCTYVEDGIEVISNGYAVLVSSGDGYFELAAYSGLKDFFKLLDKLKISNLNLSDLDHIWQVENCLYPANERADLKYLLFEPCKTGGLLKTGIAFDKLRPFVSGKRLFKQIINDQGYTLTGDFDVIDEWVCCNSLKADFAKYNSVAKLTRPFNGGVGFSLYPAWGTEVTDIKNQILLGADGSHAKFGRKGKYRIRYTGKFLFVGAEKMDFKFDTYENVIASNSNAGTVQNFDIVYEYDVTDANINRQMWIRADLANITAEASFTMYDFQVTIDLIESPIAYGDNLNIAPILPEIEQSKFLKSVANQYGLIFDVDAQRKEVYVWQFNKLFGNIPIAKDWSNYIDDTNPVITYRIGDYAQSNVMKYKEVDDVPKGYGDGALIINDQTLDTTKDLFEVDFAPSQDIIVLSNKTAAKIPLYEIGDGGAYEEKGLTDVRAVKYKQVNESIIVKNPSNTEFTITSYKLAYFIDTVLGNGLGFNYALIANNYIGLSTVLTQCKVINIKMNIPAIDIQALKHSIPVYLKQYQSYFYVNKVNSWQKNKLCTVELVKLS